MEHLTHSLSGKLHQSCHDCPREGALSEVLNHEKVMPVLDGSVGFLLCAVFSVWPPLSDQLGV